LPDTVAMGTILEFNASKSQKKDAVAQNYYWDFGDGTLEQGPLAVHSFKTVGDFPLRLGVAFKGENGVFSECVIKNIKVVDLSKIQQKKRLAHKPYFSIRDKSGNVYKIQLVTSKQRLSLNAFYFKQIGKVEEYYDRGIFGYTIGNFQKPEQCYPELKRVREKGFKEAVVIAMRENKVVSGTDESFFVKLPNNFNFIRIVAIYGKVMNSEGFPVRATIKLEDMQTGTLLDEFVSDSLTGKYKLELPVDKAYSYYIQKEGFFPFSNFIDLTKENDLSEVRSDIYLMSTTKMLKDTLGVRVNNLFFNAENNELRPESEFEVKRLAKYFKSLPNLFFEIESHSDNLGDKYSKVISCQKRADEVKKKLASLGCDPEKISAISFGESKPLTLNPKLQHINNRIEVKIKLGR
jgi:outer membrane protein OmpA-like peptidoglycan-associated protein